LKHEAHVIRQNVFFGTGLLDDGLHLVAKINGARDHREDEHRKKHRREKFLDDVYVQNF
jgi:hypothetical protein